MPQVSKEISHIPRELGPVIVMCVATAVGLLGFVAHEKAQQVPQISDSPLSLIATQSASNYVNNPTLLELLIAQASLRAQNDPDIREAVVQEGQGVLAALGNKHPILSSDAAEAVYEVGGIKLSFEELLKTNPIVQPGEIVRAKKGVPDSYRGGTTSIKPQGRLYRGGTK